MGDINLIIYTNTLICKQISASLDEKGRIFPVFFDLVDAAIKIYSNAHAPQFSWPNGIFVVPQGLQIWKLHGKEKSKRKKIPMQGAE